MPECASIVVLNITFICASSDTYSQSVMQLLSAGLSCGCGNAGSLLEGDSCRQFQAQLAPGSLDVER